MSAARFVRLDELDGLSCPWCGRPVDATEPWLVAAQERWGWIGVSLRRGNDPIGLLLVGPAAEPGTAKVGRLWVHPDQVRRGNGRRLVQAAAAGLVARDVHLLVAKGSRSRPSCSVAQRDFLRDVGFELDRDERLWVLDLDRTVVDRPSLRVVVERFLTALRPVPPQPAGRTGLRPGH